MTKRATLAVLLLLTVLVAACGGDDGAEVRSLGGSASSGSGSGSGSSSGSGSAPASGSSSGSASAPVAECSPVGEELDADQDVAVTLDEWSITPEPASIPAGVVRFNASAAGEDPHELVVVQADDVDSIPVTDEGEVDEAALGSDLVGEIEAFAAGSDCQGAFELAQGNYVLLCAITEIHDGGLENHFELGMSTEFTVE